MNHYLERYQDSDVFCYKGDILMIKLGTMKELNFTRAASNVRAISNTIQKNYGLNKK